MRILIIGLPGTGKTTWVKNNLEQNDLCFDLDWLAAAMVLGSEHERKNWVAKRVINKLLLPLVSEMEIETNKVDGNVFIIRCAPDWNELDDLDPDYVLFFVKEYDISHRKFIDNTGLPEARIRVKAAIAWCEEQRVPYKIIGNDS